MSAQELTAMEQLVTEISEKEATGQCWVVSWDAIKNNPPAYLKVSSLVVIMYKSQMYSAILNL